MTNPQKFVIDTNVIVSASLFSQSAPRQAFDRAQISAKIKPYRGQQQRIWKQKLPKIP